MLDDDDKKNFSKSVSGFANADGGVLVFGVATEKATNSPDRASKLKPITDADMLRVRLLDSVLNTTQPPVEGLQIEHIPGASGNGYVKCIIPASVARPSSNGRRSSILASDVGREHPADGALRA